MVKVITVPAVTTVTETVTATSMCDRRVVHVHDVDATSWDGDDTDFWNYVDQDAVDDMVDAGVMMLTGAGSVTAAWQAILPAYQAGEVVAIKVNMNNAGQCNDADAQIDALMEPCNAIIRGLKLIGVAEANIWITDPSKQLTNRFVAASDYVSVRFFGDLACSDAAGTWISADPDAIVAFNPPVGTPDPPETRISDVLIDADYLINMPIMKVHASTIGVSLGFKNHLGSINKPSDLHDYIASNGLYYSSAYNPMIDLYQNPHVGAKTVLTVGDGLFGAITLNTSAPEYWATFGGDVPNSLFFSRDPVAIDCVMYDFLNAETARAVASDDYLVLAANAGLGVFEHGDPWGVGYSVIDFVQI